MERFVGVSDGGEEDKELVMSDVQMNREKEKKIKFPWLRTGLFEELVRRNFIL